MNPVWLSFVSGLFVGAFFGVFLMALLQLSKKGGGENADQ